MTRNQDRNPLWRFARSARLIILLIASASQRAQAQAAVEWKVLGDTGIAPAGCSAAVAIAAIDRWFKAYNRGDSVGIASALPQGTSFVFSTGKHWVVGDTHRRIQSLPELISYVRERRARNERLALEKVVFYGWLRGDKLGFMPYFTRSAEDLGANAIAGLGKAEYRCRHGIHVLNLAPVTQALPEGAEKKTSP